MKPQTAGGSRGLLGLEDKGKRRTPEISKIPGRMPDMSSTMQSEQARPHMAPDPNKGVE
jgi:hypothetical protein